MSESADVRAVLLTGTIGSGKTALAIELGDVLGATGAGVAVMDLDWLGWFHPPAGSRVRPTDLIVRNLAAIWPNLRAEGARYLVLARMVQEAAEIDAIKGALPDATLTVVRVIAPPAVIEARLRKRDTGAELAGHLDEFAGLDGALDELQIDDLRIANEDAPIRYVAAELLGRLRWT